MNENRAADAALDPFADKPGRLLQVREQILLLQVGQGHVKHGQVRQRGRDVSRRRDQLGRDDVRDVEPGQQVDVAAGDAVAEVNPRADFIDVLLVIAGVSVHHDFLLVVVVFVTGDGQGSLFPAERRESTDAEWRMAKKKKEHLNVARDSFSLSLALSL